MIYLGCHEIVNSAAIKPFRHSYLRYLVCSNYFNAMTTPKNFVYCLANILFIPCHASRRISTVFCINRINTVYSIIAGISGRY